VIITDKLKSYGAAKQELLPGVEHRQPRRHLLSAPDYRDEMGRRFQMWGEITGTAMAA
jgi:hypothetical protein